MIHSWRKARVWLTCTTMLAASSLMTREALACATCFGNPDSSMSKGVVWGVLVLVSIVISVLAAIAGVGLFWLQRSRRLTQLDDSSSELA